MRFDRILVTTDLSDESCAAFTVAASLGDKFNSYLEVVTVVDSSPQISSGGPFDAPTMYVPSNPEEYLAETRRSLADLVGRHLPGKTSVVLESKGSTQATIVAYAEQEHFDLIVIATHGRSGVARVLLGSVAEYVARNALRCVLTVPSNQQHR